MNPPKKIETKINYIFDKIPPLGSDIGISCKLKEWKKMYIDQFGNLFPCYTYAECGYPPFDKNSNYLEYGKIIVDIKKNYKGETWVKYRWLKSGNDGKQFTEEIHNFVRSRKRVKKSEN